MKTRLFLLFTFTCLLLASSGLRAQDRVVYRDGTILPCKVLEVTPEEVSFRKASLPDGPVFTEMRNNIQFIVFENGEIELLSAPAAINARGREMHPRWADAPNYRSSFGIDIMSLAFAEARLWFEVRNASGKIGHTVNVTGIWSYYYRYGDDYFDEYYYYDPYGGGMSVGYAPKFYFIQHRVARPYFSQEAALGFHISGANGGYFRSVSRFGVSLNPTPRFNMNIDVGGGGYVIFNQYGNYGGGLLTLGVSLGLNYGKVD